MLLPQLPGSTLALALPAPLRWAVPSSVRFSSCSRPCPATTTCRSGASSAALASERLPVAYTDQELEAALLNVDGAIGLIDLATLRLDGPALHALALDGVAPEREAALAGRYPLVTPLALVTRGDALPPDARGFLDFVASAAADDLFVGPVLRPLPVDLDGDGR